LLRYMYPLPVADFVFFRGGANQSN